MLQCTGDSKDKCAAPDTEERECCYNSHLVLPGQKAIIGRKALLPRKLSIKLTSNSRGLRRLNRKVCKEGSTVFCRNTEKAMLCLGCEIFPRVVWLNIWSPARHAGIEGCVTFRNGRKESLGLSIEGWLPALALLSSLCSLTMAVIKPAVSKPCHHVFPTLMDSMPSWSKLTLFPLSCFLSDICSSKKKKNGGR